MSWRIEQAVALDLLRELPDGWAQTCVARPPRTGDPDRTLAILAEARRVLRDDGTLWVLLTPDELSLAADLSDDEWTKQPSPDWATCRGRIGGERLFLFTKGRHYFYDAHTIAAHNESLRSHCASAGRPVRRVHACCHTGEHERRLRLVKRCILAGSSLLACGECGAPYRRALPGEHTVGLRHPTCPHNNPGGCCLVLDPFYDRAGIPTADAALCTGRSFLGITEPSSTDERR